MGKRINVNFNIILRRSRSLTSVTTESVESNPNIDSNKRFDNIVEQLKMIKEGRVLPNLNSSLRSYVESISNLDNANKYFYNPLIIMENLYSLEDTYNDNYLLKEYCNKILPYIENVSYMEETVNRYDIPDNDKEMIIESARKYEIADRILANHQKISKRFNIANEVKKIKYRGLRDVVESCCSIIDTYTIAPYAKFNLCLEEMSYLFDKEGIEVNKKEFVNYVMEYFLLRTDKITSKDLKGYRLVLAENVYLTEEDISGVNYVVDPNYCNNTPEVPSIKNLTYNFLIKQDKSLEDLDNTVVNSVERTSKLDIINNIGLILWLIWKVYKNDLFEELSTKFEEWFGYIIRFAQRDDITKSDITTLINNIKKVDNLLIVSRHDDYEYGIKVSKYKTALLNLTESLEDLIFVAYSDKNIEAIQYVNRESVEEIPLHEFKIFKFHNLIRAAVNLDKFLQYKSKQIYSSGKRKTKKVVKKIKDILFGETVEQLYASIGTDNKSDLCIAQYDLNENTIEDISEYLEDVCKEFNDKLITENMDSIRCYYIINPGVAEIHLKESTKVLITEEEKQAIYETEDSSLDFYIESLANDITSLVAFSAFEESELNIEDRLVNINNSVFGKEEFDTILEALSFLDVSKEQISLFAERCSRNRYECVIESVITENEYKKDDKYYKESVDKWVKQEGYVPLRDQLTAFHIVDALLEAAPNIKKPKVGPAAVKTNKPNIKPVSNKPEDKNKSVDKKVNPEKEKEKEEKFKKNPFAGINLNTMRLYLEGLKSKMKDMSQKEKEVSRNIDNSFRMLVKSMKQALISDRREAIIKGSVIPSFSRCIKIAIGLAGLGLVTGNPVVPLVVAIGGFAASKRLTQKERILLLDEIETELDVLEKEINMAESKNQLKKYRALLKYKKDLQRQYQRIKYNIRVGKDILPNSTAGLAGSYND